MLLVQPLNAAVFRRLKSEPRGASVRAKLGLTAQNGTNGTTATVIGARELQEKIKPPCPFLVFRVGDVRSVDREVYTATWTWYVYDLPSQRYFRISELVALVARAYKPMPEDGDPRGLTVPEGVAIGGPPTVGGFSDELDDSALDLIYRTVDVSVTAT